MFKKSLFAGVLVLSFAFTFTVSAETANSVDAQIKRLQDQPNGFCFTFVRGLAVGSLFSNDVSALTSALSLEGLLPGKSNIYDEDVAAAVVQFQAKYGISRTGTVGPITRAKLNSLYGCAVSLSPKIVSTPSFANGTSTQPSLSVSASSNPSSQTIVVGSQDVLFNNLQFNATQLSEDVRVSTVPTHLTYTAGNGNDISACRLYDGATNLTTGSNVVNPSTTASAAPYTFTLDQALVIQKGTVKTIAVKCNVSGAATRFIGHFDMASSDVASMNVTGVTSTNSIKATGSATGATMTVGSSTLSVSTDPFFSDYKIASAGANNVTVGAYKFQAGNEPVWLQRLVLKLSSGSSYDLTAVHIFDGSIEVGQAIFMGGSHSATSTLSTPVLIPKGGSKTLTIKADLAPIGNASAVTESGHLVAIDFNNNDSAGAYGVGADSGLGTYATGSTAVAGVRVFKSFPSFAIDRVFLTDVGANLPLLRFKITADAHGTTGVAKLLLNFVTTGVTIKNVNVFAFTDSAYSQPVSGVSVGGALMVQGRDPSSGQVKVEVQSISGAPSALEIPAGSTVYFEVRAGSVLTSRTSPVVYTTLLGDSSYAGMSQASAVSGNFVWSPNSTTTSWASDVDWTNGYGFSGLTANDTGDESPITVEVKVNGSSIPGVLDAGSDFTLDWSSTKASYCRLSGSYFINFKGSSGGWIGGNNGNGGIFPTSGSQVFVIASSTSSGAAEVLVSCYTSGILGKRQSVSFTIAATSIPSVTILSPNGGETYKAGDTVNIKWSSQAVSGDASVVVVDAKGNSIQGSGIPTHIPIAFGSYSWKIPADFATSSSYRIAVTTYALSPDAAQDYSDGYFSIAPAPSITVLSPNGGETVVAGQPYHVAWGAIGMPTDGLTKISLLRYGGGLTDTLLAELAPGRCIGSARETPCVNINQGWANVMIRDFITPGKYIIQLECFKSGDKFCINGGGGEWDISNAFFTVTQPSVKVIWPNGGEFWTFGAKQRVAWIKNGAFPKGTIIAVYLCTAKCDKGGVSASGLYSVRESEDQKNNDGSTMPPNSAYFDWTIPVNSPIPFIKQGGKDYRIKVVAVSGARIIAQDESDTPFVLSSPAAVAVNQPIIDSLSRSSIVAGEDLTITGSNFTTNTDLIINLAARRTGGGGYTLVTRTKDPKSLTVTVPANVIVGPYTLRMTTDPSRGWGNAKTVEVVPAVGQPVITSLSRAIVTAGESLTITGSNFTTDTDIIVDLNEQNQNNLHRYKLTSNTARGSSLTFSVTTDVPPGIYEVRVKNPASEGLSNAKTLTVLANAGVPPLTTTQPQPPTPAAPAPQSQYSITVLEPKFASASSWTYKTGDYMGIRWSSTLPDTFNYDLTLVDAANQTPVRVIDTQRPKGQYGWYIPSDLSAGKYRILISGGNVTVHASAVSDAFTVAAPPPPAAVPVTASRTNQPPTVSIAGPTTITAGAQTTWTITATDPDGTWVSVSVNPYGAASGLGDNVRSYSTPGENQTLQWNSTFNQPGTYPVIVTAKDSSGAVTTSTGFTVTALPSETKVTIVNSPSAPPATLTPGTDKVVGAFDMTITGEQMSITGAYIGLSTYTALTPTGGNPVHDFYLYDDTGKNLGLFNDTQITTPTGAKTVTFPTGTHTYTVKGTVESAVRNGSIFAINAGMFWNPTGATSGKTITLPGSITLSTMTVQTPNLTYKPAWLPADLANKLQVRAGKIVAPGAAEVSIMSVIFDGGGILEDASIIAVPMRYYFYAQGPDQVSNCRFLDEQGEPLMSGDGLVSPTASDPGGRTNVTYTDYNFTFDAPLVVAKGKTRNLTLSCNVKTGASGQFRFGSTDTLPSATGVTSRAPITVASLVTGYSFSSPLYKIAPPATSMLGGSGSLLANIFEAIREFFSR